MSITLETVQWKDLKDLDEVEPLNGADSVVLEELRQVLLRQDKAERFGVCLLHKHFDVAEDEVAIEYTDHEQRISQVVVEKREDKDMGTICIARCGKSGRTHSTVHERRAV